MESGEVLQFPRPRRSKGRSRRARGQADQNVRAGAYVRVSLDKRAHKTGGRAMAEEIVSPDTQERKARAYCESMGWDLVMLEQDIDESAYRQHYSKREGLMRLLAAADRGEIDKIIVFKFNRLSRRLVEFVEICDRLEARGGGVVSLSEQYDTSTSSGRMVRNIMASFAQYQSEELSEQIYETWVTKVRRGERQPGRPPYGTKLVKGTLQPDPDTHEHLLAMFKTYAETSSVAAAVDYLNERRIPAYRTDRWSLTVVRRILSNPAYIGLNDFDGEVYQGKWAPIVPIPLWKQVQATLNGRRGAPVDRVDAHMLRGMVICSECGRAMWTQYSTRWVDGKRGSDRFYWCADPKTLRDGCNMPALHADELEAAVWAVVKSLTQDPRSFVAMVESVTAAERSTTVQSDRRAILERELARVEGLIKQLFNLLHDGDVTRERFGVMNREYDQQLHDIRAELAGLPETPAPRIWTRQELAALANEVAAAESPAARRALLTAMDVQISVTWKHVRLSVLGLGIRLPGRLMGERWYFGPEYHQLGYQGTMLTDKQIKFLVRTYDRFDKRKIAAKLGRTYEALKRLASRLRGKGFEVGRSYKA